MKAVQRLGVFLKKSFANRMETLMHQLFVFPKLSVGLVDNLFGVFCKAATSGARVLAPCLGFTFSP